MLSPATVTPRRPRPSRTEASTSQIAVTIRTAASTFMRLLRLRREPTRAHAAGVRGSIALVVLLVLVEAVERAAARADDAADGRALAGALTASGDRAARGPNRRADDRADRAVLHDFHRLVLRAGLARRVLVARRDRALARRRRHARGARGRGLRHLLRRLLLLRGAVTGRPVRDDQARHEGSRHHHPHGDRRQFPWIHRLSLWARDALPDVAAVPVRVGVAASRRRIARLRPAAGERRATAPRHDPRTVRRPGVAAGRDDGRAGRPRGLVVARHHLTDVLVGDETLGAHLTEHLLPAGAALLHRRDLIERERLRAVRAPRRRARRRRRSLAPGLGRGRRRRRVLRLEQGPRDFLVAGRELLVGAGGIRWRRDLRIRRGGAEQ